MTISEANMKEAERIADFASRFSKSNSHEFSVENIAHEIAAELQSRPDGCYGDLVALKKGAQKWESLK